MANIEWSRSKDGYVESKDGAYRINPVRQGYRPGQYRLSEKIVGYSVICQIQNIGFVVQARTQAAAKEISNKHYRKISSLRAPV